MKKRITQTMKRGGRFFCVLCVAAFAAFALFASCERPEPEPEPEPEPIEFAWEDVTNTIPCLLLSMDSITLVNDNATLSSLCPDAPTFDFSTCSLIMVSGVSSSGIDSVDVNFERVGNMQYLLTIKVIRDYTAIAQGWRKYIRTSKILNPQNISLVIKYEP